MLQVPSWDRPIETRKEWRIILNRAADIIDQHGLAKGTQRDSEGRFCIHGALNVALGRELNSYHGDFPGVEAIYRYLQSQGYTGCPTGFAYWNNEPGRTKEEVVHVLREASKLDL